MERPQPTDDWEVLFAWRDGDRRAGTQLALRYYSLLTRFFVNKVRDVEVAADLVAETFLGCTAARDRVESRGSFRSYIFAIAMNKLRGYYRTQAKRRRELDDFADICVAKAYPDSPSSLIAHAEETRLLVTALRHLTLARQIVLELHYFEGLRAVAIAALLSIPASTVRSHLHRGRARLATIVRALAANPALAESTVSGLETWARQVRDKIASTPAEGPGHRG